jgi:hypothetical protein
VCGLSGEARPKNIQKLATSLTCVGDHFQHHMPNLPPKHRFIAHRVKHALDNGSSLPSALQQINPSLTSQNPSVIAYVLSRQASQSRS